MIEEEQSGKGALAIVIVIIVLLLVGGLYAVRTDKEEPAPAATENTNEAVLSSSTDLDDIDRDLNNLNAAETDSDLDQLEQELLEL